MQKIVRLILILLLIALTGLMLLPSIQPALAGGIEHSEQASPVRSSRIVWLNADTVNEYYLGFQEIFNKDGKLLERIAEQIDKKTGMFNEKYESLNRRMVLGLISPQEISFREQELTGIGQDIEKMQRDYADVEVEAVRRNDSINIIVQSFLSDYAKQNRIDYILMHGAGSPVLYANDELEITREIILALNARHRLLKK